jgi:hypothetical protein
MGDKLDKTESDLFLKAGYEFVGCLKQDVEPHQHLVATHPSDDKVDISTIINSASTRNSALLAYNPSDSTAFTGKIKESWIKKDICGCHGQPDTPMYTPNKCTIDENVLNKCTANKSEYSLYINKNNNQNYKELVSSKIDGCIKKIQAEKKIHDDNLDQLKYQKEIAMTNSDKTFPQYKRTQDLQKINDKPVFNLGTSPEDAKEMKKLNDKLLLFKELRLNDLNQIDVSKTDDINKNYYDINSIDQKILTTSEKINNLKDKYEFNNKIIKLLRTITLWIFIITMTILCYYGVRDKYTPT